MQQLVDNRRQTAVQPSAANRSGGMGWPQPSIASAMGRHTADDRRLSREPPLTNGDPPPLMLWGEED